MAKEKEQKDTPVAADPEIERVASALKLPPEPAAEESPVVDAEPEAEAEPVVPKRKKKSVFTHRVTEFCGQLNRDGAKLLAGDGLNLSEEEAAALGKNVEPA